MRRRSARPFAVSLLSLLGVLCLPSLALAVDFADVRDAFSLSVDVHGMPACVTYPLDRLDRVECEGLDPAREAILRASAPSGTQWIATSVFRGDSWGFRLAVSRVDVAAGAMGERDDLALVRAGRDELLRTLQPGELVGELGGETTTLNGQRVARFDYAFKQRDVGLLRSIVYLVPAELGLYSVSFVADASHGAQLQAIVDRAMPSLRVRPRPRARPVASVLLFYVALPLASFLGVLLLVGRLTGGRRSRAATVSWPGLRDRGEP